MESVKVPVRQSTDSCANCKFSGSLLNANNEFRMICRRKAPVPVGQAFPTQNGQIAWATNTIWPGISASEWCGEHVAKSLLSS